MNLNLTLRVIHYRRGKKCYHTFVINFSVVNTGSSGIFFFLTKTTRDGHGLFDHVLFKHIFDSNECFVSVALLLNGVVLQLIFVFGVFTQPQFLVVDVVLNTFFNINCSHLFISYNIWNLFSTFFL